MILLTLLLCIILMTGGTFALFTGNDQTNIGISGAEVSIVATMENLSVYSPTSIDLEGIIVSADNAAIDANTFANGGKAEIDEDELSIENMTPGDKVTFDIRIENNSTVAIKYRTILAVNENDGLFSGLNVTVGGTPFANTLQSAWTNMAVDADDIIVPVEIVLPSTAGDEYQNKSAKLSFTVSAVQGNTATVDIDPEVDTLVAESNTTVNIPAGTLSVGQIAKLKVASAEAPSTVVTVDDTLIAATDISFVDADGNKVDMPEAAYSVTMDIGKDLNAAKLALYHNDQKVEPINYNAATGIISFTTDSFSPFTVMYEGIGYIDSAEDLIAVSERAAAGTTREDVEYYLTANIDLDNQAWTPINNFAGTFDGQNHTVSNLTANLFGTVSGTVKNLNVENVNILNTTKNGANGFIGTVATGGLVDNCKVSDVDIKWTEEVNAKDTTDGFGGVIAGVAAGATVQDCEFSDITVTSNGKTKRTGGVFSSITGTVKGCVFTNVNFTVADTDTLEGWVTSHGGGLACDVNGGAVVEDCVINNMQVNVYEAAGHVGGIFGKAHISGQTAPITLKDITVNGLTMNVGNASESMKCVAGFIAQPDSRKNDVRVAIDNCHINGLDMTLVSSKQGESAAAGFISGLCGGVDVTNCSVSGKIDGTNTPANIGGFIGDAGWYGAIEQNFTDCSTNVNITVNNSIGGGFIAVDGTLGNAAAILNFNNCQATGTVTVADGGTGTAAEFCGKTIE